MPHPRIAICTVMFGGILALFGSSLTSAPITRKPYPLWAFDEQGLTCRSKGRLQDHEYCLSHLMDRIVADGKQALPTLISQLTGTRATKQPIYDYWNLTTEGDIAYFILMDFFTEPNGTFLLPGLDPIRLTCKEVDSETCWRGILKKRGRKFIQEQWLRAWNENKESTFWDETSRCFRLAETSNAK